MVRLACCSLTLSGSTYDIDSRPSATPYVQESGSGESGDVEMSSLPSAEWGHFMRVAQA